MSLLQTVVLALVQGITEFLPISSSAHLILVSRWMDWVDQGLHFDMAVHAGSAVAVMVYLRHDIARILRSFGGGTEPSEVESRRFGHQILAATIPVALAGWWLQEPIERYAREPRIIAICSIVFGVLLWAADRWGQKERRLEGLDWSAVLFMGMAQALALLPGTSRSGIVMTAGLMAGLRRTAAARFSFLLAVPVMLLVAVKDLIDLTTGGVVAPDWPAILLGFVISAASAYLAVDWLLRWLERQGMAMFAIYRIALGGAILLFGLS